MEGEALLLSGSPASLPTGPSWISDHGAMGSEAVIGDVNGDGWPELLYGTWGFDSGYYDHVRAYASGYGLPPSTAASWISGTDSVIERLLLGDVNNDGLRTTVESFPADGTRKTFYLCRIRKNQSCRPQHLVQPQNIHRLDKCPHHDIIFIR